MELDGSTLHPIVGHALDASVAIPVEWSSCRSWPGMARDWVCSVSRARQRVGGEPRAWSVILKVLPAIPGSPTGWHCPAREALAYERGLLDDLPPGLVAPPVFRSRGAGRPALPVA